MKKIMLWGIGIFISMQFVPVDRTNPPVDSKKNFASLMQPPKPVLQILKNACYDCHSNEVNYPSYAYLAPVSWTIKQHVNEGREHVNFSEWAGYNKDQRSHIIEEIIETTESKEMPMKGYVPLHPEANLTEAQRKMFGDYFKQLQESKNF